MKTINAGRRFLKERFPSLTEYCTLLSLQPIVNHHWHVWLWVVTVTWAGGESKDNNKWEYDLISPAHHVTIIQIENYVNMFADCLHFPLSISSLWHTVTQVHTVSSSPQSQIHYWACQYCLCWQSENHTTVSQADKLETALIEEKVATNHLWQLWRRKAKARQV